VRLLSIDILRTVAIGMMVLVHFSENLSAGYGLPAIENALARRPWWMPTGLAAPLFALLSGVSYRAWLTVQHQRGLADTEISKRTVRRGLFLIGLGFFFNVFVWLPEDTFNWDILTFIGSALILLNLIRRMPSELPPLLIVIIVVMSPVLRSVADYGAYWSQPFFDYDFTLSDVLLGYLVVGYFPLFPWLIFPIAGFAAAPLVLPRQLNDHQSRPLPPCESAILVRGGVALAILAVLLHWAPLPAALGSELRWTMFPASTRYLLGTLAGTLASVAILHRLVDLRPDSGAGNHQSTTGAAHICRVLSRHSLSLYLLHHVVHIWPLWLYGLATTGEPTSPWQTLLPLPAAVALACLFCLLCIPLFLTADRHKWPTVESLMRWVAD
jgi:uncharacterized membrane protein